MIPYSGSSPCIIERIRFKALFVSGLRILEATYMGGKNMQFATKEIKHRKKKIEKIIKK